MITLISKQHIYYFLLLYKKIIRITTTVIL